MLPKTTRAKKPKLDRAFTDEPRLKNSLLVVSKVKETAKTNCEQQASAQKKSREAKQLLSSKKPPTRKNSWYRIGQERLPATKQLAEGNRKLLENTEWIVLQHALNDTELFLSHLRRAGAVINTFIAKPFSEDKKISKRIESYTQYICKPYEVLEDTNLLNELLKKACESCLKNGKKLHIVDVGGYFSKPLLELKADHRKVVAGVIEVTTFGHRRYAKTSTDIRIPVGSIANSKAKEHEARFVGQRAVSVLENMLHDLGCSVHGGTALVFGYGKIGKNVARALKARDLKVAVYDTRASAILEAQREGFIIYRSRELALSDADIILCSTGAKAISVEDLMLCKNSAIVGSVGSKQHEIDVLNLQSKCKRPKILVRNSVKSYQLPNDGPRINILREGKALNFHSGSCPDEIMDFVHAEALSLSIRMYQESLNFQPGELHESPSDIFEGNAQYRLTLLS